MSGKMDIGLRTLPLWRGLSRTMRDNIEKVFKDMEIPYFIDSKKSVLGNSLVEFVRAALDMVYKDFSYESVFRYLRTGFTDYTRGVGGRHGELCSGHGHTGEKPLE